MRSNDMPGYGQLLDSHLSMPKRAKIRFLKPSVIYKVTMKSKNFPCEKNLPESETKSDHLQSV